MYCSGYTNDHKKCKNLIKNGENFCYLHVNARPYSQIQIKWIKELEKTNHIKIRHALSTKSKSKKLKCVKNGKTCGKCNECRGGEYYILGIGKVDGYCKKTNTVYEFHGDYWHGNPNLYPENEIHPIIGISYGQLYRNTLDRDNKIRNLGYNLVVIWESEYKNTLLKFA